VRFKARPGGARDADPSSVRAELGLGSPLPAGVRARMESAFGASFAGVRVHTDATGAQLSDQLNARAFTVGQQVAFGRGEFQPGTILGDALIAHELAHVVQQGGAAPSAPMTKGAESGGPVEADADRAAVGAVASLWGLGRVAGALAGRVRPSVRSGLRLSRCSKDGTKKAPPATKPSAPAKKGTWSITQNSTDGSASTPYRSAVRLTFSPDPAQVNCSEIAFVQGVRHVDSSTSASVNPIPTYQSRMTSAGWTLDRINQRKYGWYGYNNDGTPSGLVTPGSSPSPLTNAVLRDTPTNSIPNSSLSFETCAICRTGTDSGTIYGCYTWGFDVDSSYHVTDHASAEQASPSADFNEVVSSWNAQAAGPAARRNAPDQQPLGPFR
jgi:hypothetical protein